MECDIKCFSFRIILVKIILLEVSWVFEDDHLHSVSQTIFKAIISFLPHNKHIKFVCLEMIKVSTFKR